MMTAQSNDDVSEFFSAIKHGDRSSVLGLLDREPTLVHARTEDGLTPVVVAKYGGEDDLAELLVQRGAEIDLFEATVLGHVDRLEALLAADPAALHAYSMDGWTALHLAGHFGQSESARILLDRGADVGAISHNRNGNTSLHAALAGRQRDVSLVLLDGGANVTTLDASGWSPLHLAAHWGNVELVSLLLRHGADVEPTNQNGATPLVLAKQQGHDDVVALLTSAGATT